MENGKKVKILITGTVNETFPLYRKAIENSGGTVTDGYLPENDGSFDGLLVAGGCDISPKFYSGDESLAVRTDIARDKCEFKLIDEFVKAGKPVFGICRGMQILNIYFGGTLIGDLPKTPKHHSDTEKIYHGVNTEKGFILNKIYGDFLPANSFHHQAVNKPGDGFSVTAFSVPDNVPEAIEHKNGIWFGVQFHPERMLGNENTADAKPLFDYFLSLCKK